MSVEETSAGNGTFAALYCILFGTPSLGRFPLPLCQSINSPTTGILHTICHLYRSVWPAREAKPRSGATLVRSAHDWDTRLFTIQRHTRRALRFFELWRVCTVVWSAGSPGLYLCPVGRSHETLERITEEEKKQNNNHRQKNEKNKVVGAKPRWDFLTSLLCG